MPSYRWDKVRPPRCFQSKLTLTYMWIYYVQGGAEGQGLQIPLPPLRALPAAKECPTCHLWKPGSEFLKISRSADGLAHKCKACAMKAADGPTREEKPCSKCKEMKSKDAFCINKYMADGMQVRYHTHVDCTKQCSLYCDYPSGMRLNLVGMPYISFDGC